MLRLIEPSNVLLEKWLLGVSRSACEQKPAEVRMDQVRALQNIGQREHIQVKIVYEVGGLDETLMKDALRKSRL